MAQLPHIDSSVRGDDHPRKWAAMAVLGAVAFMAQLDLFVVKVALPAMGDTYAGSGCSSWRSPSVRCHTTARLRDPISRIRFRRCPC